jgi:hypothetical protein
MPSDHTNKAIPFSMRFKTLMGTYSINPLCLHNNLMKCYRASFSYAIQYTITPYQLFLSDKFIPRSIHKDNISFVSHYI